MLCWSCSLRNTRQRTRPCVRVTDRRSSSCGTDCRFHRRKGRLSANTWSRPRRGIWTRWEDAADYFSCSLWTAVSSSSVAAVFPCCLIFICPPQLQTEVQRLEELKLQNIRNVIDAIRSEIAVFWEKCFLSTDQRQAFTPYFSGGFSCLSHILFAFCSVF